MDFYERIDARGAWETGRPVSFIPKGALTHHWLCQRWYPSRWSGACALPEASAGRFSRGGRQCQKPALPVQAAVQLSLPFCFARKTRQVAKHHLPPRRLPAKTCHRQLLADVVYCVCRTPFLFAKRNKTKGR